MKHIHPKFHEEIIHAMSTPVLFNLISGKTSTTQILRVMGYTLTEKNTAECKLFLKEFYALARQLFLKRRGTEASTYQSAALNAWLNHIKKGEKLSFIEDEHDKHALLVHLDAALKDPESSRVHKLRCCLLINKLYPKNNGFILNLVNSLPFSTELTNEKLETIIAALIPQAKTFDGESIDALISLWPYYSFQKQGESIVESLIEAIDNENSEIKFRAMLRLKDLRPNLSATQYERAARAFLDQLTTNFDTSHPQYINTMIDYITKLSQPEEIDSVLDKVLSKLSDSNAWSRKDAVQWLGYLSPALKTQTQITRVFQALMRELNDVDAEVRGHAIRESGSLASVLRHPEDKLLMLNSLLLTLQHKNTYWDIPTIIQKPLCEALRSLSSVDLIDQCLETVIIKVKNLNPENCAAILSGLTPGLSTERQKEKLIAELIHLLEHPRSRMFTDSIAIYMLENVIPHLKSKDLETKVLKAVAKHLTDDELAERILYTNCSTCIHALLSPEQIEATVSFTIPILQNVNEGVPNYLSKLIPYLRTEKQRTDLFNCLSAKLLDQDSQKREDSVDPNTQLIPFLHEAQLRMLIDMPGENNPELMQVKLIALTRQHIKALNFKLSLEQLVEYQGSQKPLLHSRGNNGNASAQPTPEIKPAVIISQGNCL